MLRYWFSHAVEQVFSEMEYKLMELSALHALNGTLYSLSVV